MQAIKYFRPHINNAVINKEENNINSYRIDNNIAYIDLRDNNADIFLATAENLFTHFEIDTIKVNYDGNLRPDLDSMKTGDTLTLGYSDFFQLPNIWTKNSNLIQRPIQWTKTDDVVHPVRPLVNQGEILYSRFVPSIQKNISFHVIDIEKDLDIFHAWHNQPRVSHFWELNKSRNELEKYLHHKITEDNHTIPTIVMMDATPIGYFEFYWIKEDRLGPIYESGMFDRGFHLLIGEIKACGFANTDAVLKSTCHYIYLDEIKTQKICAEPRHDNSNIIKYVATFPAWRRVKEFDFPHKRSVLLECTRDKFFMGRYL